MKDLHQSYVSPLEDKPGTTEPGQSYSDSSTTPSPKTESPSLPRPNDPVEALVEAGPLQINGRTRSVRLRDRELSLTSGEFEVLWVIANRAGEPVSRDELFKTICGTEYDGLDRTIDIRVARLRKKLGDRGRGSKLVLSIRGVGYMLATE